MSSTVGQVIKCRAAVVWETGEPSVIEEVEVAPLFATLKSTSRKLRNSMGGNNEWDNRLTDSLKNYNLNSPEVKQQFEQIGLTPEEVISKIMANPDVAMAFQNPTVQAAILDCSQNPLSIAKYQNDK